MKKNMKMMTTAAALLVLSAAILTGCGGKKKAEVNVDVKSLAAELNGTVTSDTLTEAQESMIRNIYYFDDSYVAGDAYMSDGTTSCEVAVVECKDDKGAQAAAEKLKSRVSSQKDLYASYNAEEAGRLDKAIIKTAGKYAVLAVVDDTGKAEDILKNAGF